jgi:hypothetical protein
MRITGSSNWRMPLLVQVIVLLGGPTAALGNPADRSLSPTNIFAPASSPAHSIFGLSLFVLAVTAAIFVIVFSLLTYCVVRFRKRAGDDGREPPQVYGSTQVELAWTVIPVLIVSGLSGSPSRKAKNSPNGLAERAASSRFDSDKSCPRAHRTCQSCLHGGSFAPGLVLLLLRRAISCLQIKRCRTSATFCVDCLSPIRLRSVGAQ